MPVKRLKRLYNRPLARNTQGGATIFNKRKWNKPLTNAGADRGDGDVA